MKKLVSTIVLLAGAATVYSQGVVNYSDYNGTQQGFNIHIWSPNPAAPTVEQTGNSSTLFTTSTLTGDAPSGTMNSYGGVRIGGAGSGASAAGGVPGTAASGYANGDNFNVELYAGAGTLTTFSSLSPVAASLAQLPDVNDGASYSGLYFNPGSGTLHLTGTGTGGQAPTVAIGSPVTFAFAAWYNGGSTATSLATAIADGYPYGISPLGTENAGGGTGNPPFLPGAGDSLTTAGGITSFSLVTATPEPSTIALGVVGASAFLMRLRRKV